MQIAFIFTIIYPMKNTAVETTCRVVIQDVSVSRNLTSQTVAGDLAMGGVPTLGRVPGGVPGRESFDDRWGSWARWLGIRGTVNQQT